MHNAVNEASQLKMTSPEMLMWKGGSSHCECDHKYRHCAAEILDNSIDKAEFKEAFTKAISDRWEKGSNNIMLIGSANYGKSFILQSLTETEKFIVSPAPGTSAWIGAEKAEEMFLSDLRWNEGLILWCDFLNLLEWLPVQLQAQKSIILRTYSG